MASTAISASSYQRSPEHVSTEAYALPRILDVAPPDPGVVTALLVHEQDYVSSGQPVARVRPVASPRDGKAAGEAEVVVRAPTAGLVVRCWAEPGELVRSCRAILSITSADEVLVVARFGRAALGRLRRGGEATALIGRTARATAARIVSVAELPDHEGFDGDGPVRVVLRLPAAPTEALWPGTRATIEV